MTSVHTLFPQILCRWNLFMANFLHNQHRWMPFTSNLPSQEHLSSFNSYSFCPCSFFFFAVCSCWWLFPSRLVSVSSNNMKSPVRIPHTTPWCNSSEGVFVLSCVKVHTKTNEHISRIIGTGRSDHSLTQRFQNTLSLTFILPSEYLFHMPISEGVFWNLEKVYMSCMNTTCEGTSWSYLSMSCCPERQTGDWSSENDVSGRSCSERVARI